MGKGKDPENYVIRIHHRDPNDPKKMTGVVEGAGGKEKTEFAGLKDLWRILASSGREPPPGEQTPSMRRKGDEFMSLSEIMASIREEWEKGEDGQ